MRNIRKVALLLGLAALVGAGLMSGCGSSTVQSGIIQGAVTVGPVFPGPAILGDTRPVPPEVFSARKVVIYDSSGKNVVQTVDIRQIGQTATGYYVAQVKPGTYVVDIKKNGIDHAFGLPKTVTVTSGGTMVVDINIDTGIR